jgi:hypothetical protein
MSDEDLEVELARVIERLDADLADLIGAWRMNILKCRYRSTQVASINQPLAMVAMRRSTSRRQANCRLSDQTSEDLLPELLPDAIDRAVTEQYKPIYRNHLAAAQGHRSHRPAPPDTGHHGQNAVLFCHLDALVPRRAGPGLGERRFALVKIHVLLARRGVEVPYRTLHRAPESVRAAIAYEEQQRSLAA